MNERLVVVLTLCVFCVCVLSAASVTQATVTSYHVGNSLTWDTRPDCLPQMAQDAGIDLLTGYHIQCAKPLSWIVANPDLTCINPNAFGRFATALPGYEWDFVTFQPWNSISLEYPGLSTLASDQSAIEYMVGLTHEHPGNADTIFYIYAAYPAPKTEPDGTYWIDYPKKWLKSTTTEPGQRTVLARSYFETLINNVRDAQPPSARPVLMIPVGEVIYELDCMMKSGELPGFTGAIELYRGRGHLNNVGRFVARTTFFTTLFREDPTGLPVPSDLVSASPHWESDRDITPELAEILQTTVWAVVSEHPYSGVPEPSTPIALLSMTVVVGLLAYAHRKRRSR